jgi:hypothetical protein
MNQDLLNKSIKGVQIWDADNVRDMIYDRYLVVFPDGASYRISQDASYCKYEGYNVKPAKFDKLTSKVPNCVKEKIYDLL